MRLDFKRGNLARQDYCTASRKISSRPLLSRNVYWTRGTRRGRA
ncbi:hypothetical protein ACNKHX_23815 [Shigella flexneri]